MTELERSIVATVAFFDIFNYPLTDFEIWQYLDVRASLEDVRGALSSLRTLETHGAFFFLPGRRDIIQVRLRRYRDAEQKIAKARRRLRLISWLPWLRLIALANMIGTNNLRPEADIDLFIVAKRNRLWLVKLFATTILALTRLRPRPGVTADTLCLSFLVDETALDVSNLRLPGDRYLTYWFDGLVPLYGDATAYAELRAANEWYRSEMPNRDLALSFPRKRFSRRRWHIPETGIGALAERIARRLQRAIMSPAIRDMANRDHRVIVSDHVLKLHTTDRRLDFIDQYAKRLKQLLSHSI